MHYIVLIFVTRWRHNVREIAVKNYGNPKKSAEKFVRTTSYRQLRDLKKFCCSCLWPRLDVHLYIFSVRRYKALTASVKFRIGIPKTARNEQVCAHQNQNHTGSKFSKIFLSSCIQDRLQLCTYIAVFLRGVRWRHYRAPNLEPRFLVNFLPV